MKKVVLFTRLPGRSSVWGVLLLKTVEVSLKRKHWHSNRPSLMAGIKARRYFNACTCIELEEGYETCALRGRVDQRLIKRKCKYFGILATAALVEVQREPTAMA